MTDEHQPPGSEIAGMDMSCPTDVAEHIAAIEAGWTLPKPWKARDEDAKEAENIAEVREMIERWRAHGIEVR